MTPRQMWDLQNDILDRIEKDIELTELDLRRYREQPAFPGMEQEQANLIASIQMKLNLLKRESIERHKDLEVIRKMKDAA